MIELGGKMARFADVAVTMAGHLTAGTLTSFTGCLESGVGIQQYPPGETPHRVAIEPDRALQMLLGIETVLAYFDNQANLPDEESDEYVDLCNDLPLLKSCQDYLFATLDQHAIVATGKFTNIEARVATRQAWRRKWDAQHKPPEQTTG